MSMYAEQYSSDLANQGGLGTSLVDGNVIVNNIASTTQRFQLNKIFVKRAWRIAGIFFPGWKTLTTALMTLLILLVILKEYVVYQVGIIASKYYKILTAKDSSAFIRHTIFSLLIIIAIAFCIATVKYVSAVLRLKWRYLLTKHAHRLYFTDINYYIMNVLDSQIDNPDQRMTTDIDRLCLYLSEIIAEILIAPFLIAFYMYQSWTIAGYISPLCVVVFFLVSSFVNRFLMSWISLSIFQQEKNEGDFRFKHMQIRSNSESAAFYRSGSVECRKTDEKFSILLKTQECLVAKQYCLNFSISCADYFGSILSFLIIAIPIFGGAYDDEFDDISSIISKNSFIVMYLINVFTRLIDVSMKAATVVGMTHRVAELLEFSSDYHSSGAAACPELVSHHELPCLSIKHLTFCLPNSYRITIKDLSLDVWARKNLLITGDSGCGKSSLLRVVNRLWKSLEGEVSCRVCDGVKGIMFIPQNPFFTNGTLKEQIVYPLDEEECDDAMMVSILEFVGLMNLHERLDGLDGLNDWNWYDQLSPGEMQRLSFARIFYHKPTIAVLDESTSQISEATEEKMYHRLASFGITVISVAHRSSLRRFHSQELRLHKDGTWSIEDIHLREVARL